MQRTRLHNEGFTLVELLTALMVTGIILAAVTSLAFALNSADEGTGNMSKNQAVLRYATLRLRDSIRFSNSVEQIAADGSFIEFWADANYDGVVDAQETWRIEKGGGGTSLVYRDSAGAVTLVPECSNIQFTVDDIVPNTRFVSVSFDMESGSGTYKYQVSGSMLCLADHKL